MEGVTRWVNLGFVFAGLILWWVFGNVTESIYGFVEVTNRPVLGENLSQASLIGLGAAVLVTLGMWRNKNLYESGIHIAQELKKVTWPDWPDTKYATWVVIITTLIIAVILAVFDFTFQNLTNMLLDSGS